jgi:hypothetical protein
MLAKRGFAGLDLYLAGFLTRPLMAVPCVAAHGRATLRIEVLATQFLGFL